MQNSSCVLEGSRSFFPEWNHGVQGNLLAQGHGWRWSESPGTSAGIHGAVAVRREFWRDCGREKGGDDMRLQGEQGAHIYILTDLRTVERIRGASARTFQLLVRMYLQVWVEP